MMLTNWHRVVAWARSKPAVLWITVLGLLALLYLLVWLPLTHIGIPCPILAVTGLYCPGCGMTRAAASLLQFDFYQSFRYNAMPVALVPGYSLYYFFNKSGAQKLGQAVLTVLVVVVILYGVLRNLPFGAWLAPVTLN